MTLLSRITSRFLPSAATSRDGGDGMGDGVVKRTTAQLLAFLNNWAGDSGTDGLKDPYLKSPWVSSAVQIITGPIAQVGLKFFEGEKEITDSTLAAFWNRPMRGMARNSRASRFDTIEATVGWLCLNGEFFWILDDTWLTRGPVKSPFIVARPDSMTPIVDDGELIGWRFRDGAKREHDLIPDQVITSRRWNPYNDFRGAAPLESAMMAASADYAASRTWKSLAETNGDLGENVIAPNGVTEPQQEQIKLMLKRKREAAKKGKFLPAFYVGDIKVTEPHIKSPDSAAAAQRLQNRQEVYIALGVPPSFAETTASYSIGSASDRFKLIEETCMPIATKIAEAVEEVSSRLLGGRSITASFNFDNHSTMQQVRAERLESGRKLHERGIPWEVISNHLDLGLPAFPGSKDSWLPYAVQRITDNKPGTPEPTSATGKASSAVTAFEELEELLKGCPAHPRAHLTSRTPEKKAEPSPLWIKQMNSRAPHVKRIRGIVDRALFEARKETLANISQAADAEKAIRAGAFDFIFDLANFLELLIEPIFKADHAAYEAAGAELIADEMGLDTPFIGADPLGLQWLQERKNHIQDAGQKVWEEVRDSLEEGVNAGESFEKLSRRVREQFNGFSKERGMRVAVTEIGIAFGTGRFEAMQQAGAGFKGWYTSDDGQVRDTHQRLHNKVIPIDEPFDVGGFPMMYPCDPSGPPQEIIRCRCIHGPADEPTGPDESDIEGNNPDAEIPF
ncbi:phage portal protein [Luteolibacter pohnpeiensis]|uniref:Phage portal protein n=1 Tax=Luteolibacter pohnpeiensis TaxID=454153 RepID=A0A934S6R4_9BACT|nr:phage portal protein [Luteolibacter pohnpeiensis]MBK1884110.1 phage portal protein [Luteolibacter pohnpeiensis]